MSRKPHNARKAMVKAKKRAQGRYPTTPPTQGTYTPVDCDACERRYDPGEQVFCMTFTPSGLGWGWSYTLCSDCYGKVNEHDLNDEIGGRAAFRAGLRIPGLSEELRAARLSACGQPVALTH